MEGYASGSIKYRRIKGDFSNKLVQVYNLGEELASNTSAGRLPPRLRNEEDNKSINCVEFLPSGRHFLSGSNNGVINLFDIARKKPASTLKFHKNRVFAIKTIDESTFLSAGWDHTVFLYDLRARNAQKYIYGPMVFGDSLDYKDN